MKFQGIDFVKLLKGYNSGWVAISSDFKKVVATGKTIEETKKKVKKGEKRVYFFPAAKSYPQMIG